MSVLSNTSETPITLGAVHSLLTEWRQTHPAKTRIPYLLILEIASLIGRYPDSLIRQTLKVSTKQLETFEAVYKTTYNRQEQGFTQNSSSSPMLASPVDSKDTFVTSSPSLLEPGLIPPPQSKPVFIKATYEEEDSLTSSSLSSVKVPKSVLSLSSPQNQPTIPIILKNKQGLTFEINLLEGQALLFMKTFMQSS